MSPRSSQCATQCHDEWDETDLEKQGEPSLFLRVENFRNLRVRVFIGSVVVYGRVEGDGDRGPDQVLWLLVFSLQQMKQGERSKGWSKGKALLFHGEPVSCPLAALLC